MRDMEAAEQISLPGMFCTQRQVLIINVMFLSLTAEEQRNEIGRSSIILCGQTFELKACIVMTSIKSIIDNLIL